LGLLEACLRGDDGDEEDRYRRARSSYVLGIESLTNAAENGKFIMGKLITITAFERSPNGGKGLARDMPVRWALEEAANPTRFVFSLSVH
jgi:hypothetical protein